MACLASMLFLIGCEKNPVRARLADIESYSESNPDSARKALEAIDPSFLNTRRLQAQHALMLSTALSRCKAKVSNDSLISIAVDYYDRFGPRKEKFLSHYYQGRVYHDLKEYESAMQAFLEAESVHSKDISLRYLTSLHMLKGELYQSYYDYDKAVKSFRKAQEYALQCNWRANYLSALIGECSQHVIFEREEKVDSLIQIIQPYREEMSLTKRMAFDNNVLLKHAPKESLLVYARAFEEAYSSLDSFTWDCLSTCYTRAGAFSDAERALSVFEKKLDDPKTDLKYLKAYIELKDSLGLYKESQEAKVAFQEILGRQVYEKGVSDLRFLEERMMREKRTKELSLYIAIGSLILFLLCTSAFFELRKRSKQKEGICQLYASLKGEYESMNKLLQNNSSIQEEARTLLGQRVKSLAQFLSAAPPSSLNRVADQLDSLTGNRKELLETIGLLYAVYYPAFVYRLHDYGLSNGEVGYCCLLILGFRTGEIGDVINRSSTYHISSAIRQKVGLGPNDTNLSIFLKNLFKETES